MKEQVMKAFKMSDTTYTVLKWAVSIVLPGLVALVGVIGNELNWAFTESFMTIGTAVIAFLGISLGISTSQYNKEKKEDEQK